MFDIIQTERMFTNKFSDEPIGGMEYIMREQIREMSDRELRAYKRRLRRQRELRRRIALTVMTVCLIATCVISYHSLTSSANSGEDEVSLKYYTSVTVMSGESLWTIADEFIDYSHYKSKDRYIAEICSINNLQDASDIRAGQRLVVPYYSSDFVK